MGIACTICKGRLTQKIIHHTAANDRNYDVYWCEPCAAGSVHPMPETSDLPHVYSSGYRAEEGKRFTQLVEHFVYLSRVMRKRRIKRFVKQGSILDIGCGRGLFLDIMRKDGWAVTGTELSREIARKVSETRGIRVLSGEPSGWGLDDDGLDVITISHVLEHLPAPARMLEQCRRLLRRGGILVCATPNSASMQALVGKGEWFHLDIPHHLNFFSEAGLLRLLQKHGFTIARVRRFDIEYDPFGWLQTLLNMSGIHRNYFYSLLKGPELRKRELDGTGKGDLILTLLMLPFYIPLAFTLSLFESFILKRGGSVEVVAIKQ